MATTQPKNRYVPAPRIAHQTIRVDGNVYMWAGKVDGMPHAHDHLLKSRLISCVEVFHCESRDWMRLPTSGAPPRGVSGYGCTAVGDTLHFFGGYCNHGNCYHNSIHSLSTSSLNWVELSPTTSEGGAPMRKAYCGTVAFKDGDEHILYVVAGFGSTPSYCQPGAEYEAVDSDRVRCNEQHMFSLSTREWSLPSITGQPPSPCSGFTLTPVGERRAALFGMSGAISDDLLIVELSRDTVHWTRINEPINRSVEWPKRRYHHAATCMSGHALLVIMGGYSEEGTISDCWIGDLTKKQWKKLALPNSITERCYHSLSALQLSPHSVLLVIFGGRRSLTDSSVKLSHTVLIELILQEDDGGQWVVGKILEGTAVKNMTTVHQQMLSKWKSTAVGQGVIHQLEEVQQQLQQESERAREVEQRLTREKEQVVQQSQQAREREQQLNQQLTETSEQNQQLTREKEQMTREKEQLTREKEQMTREKEQLTREKEQLIREMEQAMREKERVSIMSQQLQTANTQSQQQVQQLRQQLSVMSIAEGREEWVVRREEVELTDKVLGRGAWGEVKVAKFRGLRVAAKILHNMIISEYNRRQFTREMAIAAKIRHPNLLLFIGATREGEAVILTELMPTSLRRELEMRVLPRVQITSIAQDVACALCYLHQWRPSPIIHRDISSANVLLDPLNNGWRAKVSDYGSANFMNAIATAAPGSPVYAAPEACNPDQHSPKMDTFSYGVLLVEMCIRELPESSPAQREAQILQIQWAAMVSLVRRCTSERPADRPSMGDIMELLVSFPHLDVTRDVELNIEHAQQQIKQFQDELKVAKSMIDTVEQEKSELVKDLQGKQDKIARLQKQLKIPETVSSTVQTVPQSMCEIGTQFSYLVPMAEHLHGVHVSDEKLFSLSGDDGPHLLEWGENGFRIQVPEGATSGPCDIAVKVIVAGQFEFPDNAQLVSAVYAISPSRKLKKPVQLEIQHCVSIASKQLGQSIGFIRADCKQPNLPYKFYPLEGGEFRTGSYYGNINCQEFSLVAIIAHKTYKYITAASDANEPQEADGDDPSKNMNYVAQVYYMSRGRNKWTMKFIVTKNLEAYIAYVTEKHHDWEEGDHYMFKFSENALKLHLEKEEIPVNGWVIICTVQPCLIFKQAVDDCKQILPPSLLVELRAHEAKTYLRHAVPVTGIDPEIQLIIYRDFEETSVSPAVPVLPEATPIPPLGAPPTLLNLKTMKGADGKSLKIVETIAAHDYTTFGMCLLQDVNAEVVDLIEKDHISKGAERVTKEILKKWLTSDASTRTYQYLIECLRQSELGALAELITTVQVPEQIVTHTRD